MRILWQQRKSNALLMPPLQPAYKLTLAFPGTSPPIFSRASLPRLVTPGASNVKNSLAYWYFILIACHCFRCWLFHLIFKCHLPIFSCLSVSRILLLCRPLATFTASMFDALSQSLSFFSILLDLFLVLNDAQESLSFQVCRYRFHRDYHVLFHIQLHACHYVVGSVRFTTFLPE